MLPGKSGYVNVDGINTHYIAAGEGPPLLLIHGLGASVITWRDNIEPLSRSFRVYAIDLPGHGDTDKPDLDYKMETITKFVLQFMEVMGLDKVYYIGNSAGGAVGLQMAVDHPEKLHKLVLVDCAGLGRDISFYVRLVTLPFIGSLLESSRVGGPQFMLYNVFYDKSFVSDGLLQELYRSRQMPGAKEAVVRSVKNGMSLFGLRKKFLYLDKLKDLDVPLMVAWGAQDQIFPVAHAYVAAKAAPNIALKVFDQCGHWPHMEKADEFNSAVMDFLTP